MEKVLGKIVKKEGKENKFLRFDEFIIREMGFSLDGEEEKDEIRHQAVLEFRRRTNRKEIATLPTIWRWFGKNSFKKPSREKVYEMCFAMRLGKEDTERFLVVGLGEPSFQINDYQELIYLYGLENGVDFETCQKMGKIFEQGLDRDWRADFTHNTEELKTEYELVKEKNIEEFLTWMGDRTEWFKGYSQTSLTYLKRIRSRVIYEIRCEAKSRLDELLGETDYTAWRKKTEDKGNKENEGEYIKQFVNAYQDNRYYKVSKSLGESILELVKIVYSSKETNIELLNAVYASQKNQKKDFYARKTGVVWHMTPKHLSDLLNTPQKREKIIKTRHIMRVLEGMLQESECPVWIRDEIEEEVKNVSEAREKIEKSLKEQKRRCLQIQRSDLLPMIHFVAQSQYERNHEEYKQEEARDEFIKLADATLGACNMALLSEEFALDTMLLACFLEKEMYTYSELLDTLYGKEEEDVGESCNQ